MQNEIPTRQNLPENIKLLRAQRSVYHRAKRFLAAQVVLTVVLPVIASLCVAMWPELKAVAAAVALCVVVVDVTLLDRLQRDLRKLAAKIQEVFDCDVLSLKWNAFTVGGRPDPESIHEASSKYGLTHDRELADWYPTVVGEVPIHMARIICQRTNLFYDARLRRRFANWTLTASLVIGGLLFVLGVMLRLSLDAMVLGVVTPVVPIVVWGLREHQRQKDAAEASDRLKAQAEDLWNRLLDGGCTESDCTAQARLFQNAIFERRSSAPVVFEWIYRFMRPQLEGQMNVGAAEMVRAVSTQAK
jgi:hypothetical protein